LCKHSAALVQPAATGSLYAAFVFRIDAFPEAEHIYGVGKWNIDVGPAEHSAPNFL